MSPPQLVPIESPAAWRGNALFEREDWLYSLTEDDIEELKAALERSQAVPIERINRDSFPLKNLATKLNRLQSTLETGGGASMVQGFPIDEFVEEDLKRLFFGMSVHVGTPVSQSATGERVFSVRDEGYAPTDRRARGPNTKKALSFHTDRCDVIAFLCVKQAKAGGENQVVSSITVFNELLRRFPMLLEEVMKPLYYKRHNVDTGNNKPYIQQPIFSIFEGHFAANILRTLIDRAYEMPELPNMTENQRAALNMVESVAREPELCATFRQRPGDILFLNNFVTFHNRGEFTDHEDVALRRHLLRIWLSVPNSRPLDPMFAANYGSTEAGAIRGGMPPA